MRSIVSIAIMFLAAALVVPKLVDRGRTTQVASASAVTAAPVLAAPSNNSRSIVLDRASNGHFQTEARVDGRRLEFVVDTGASYIALRESDAARLGIHPTQRDYSVKVNTANGVTRATLVQLNMVEVGNIVVRDVPALVHPDQALGVNLLGMSFLSKVRWTHDRGKLVLEQ